MTVKVKVSLTGLSANATARSPANKLAYKYRVVDPPRPRKPFLLELRE